LLALADDRTPEQVEADEEIDRTLFEDPRKIMRAWQDAVGAAAGFFDLWAETNNLPPPPCPGHAASELMFIDLSADLTIAFIHRQIREARRQERAQLRLLADTVQLSLL
jgi:hypothetical protein